ncbi:MAG: hypothetical protein ABUL62_25080 [Myxococcales bacterium]
MRALAACLTLFLGLGVMTALATTMAGCSDSTDTGGSGGASGASTAAGASSGGASAGAGAGGMCSFTASDCTGCLSTKCTDDLTACSKDASCKAALGDLQNCACSGTSIDDCAAAFYQAGGTPAEKLTNCYSLNCTDACM